MTKYEKVALELTTLVQSNLKEGIYKLPTEASLCQKYHVSRQTIRCALSLLQEKGIISSKQGSGSYATGLSVEDEQNCIPILISNNQEYVYPSLLQDINSNLSASHYTTKLYVTDHSTSLERSYLETLLQNPPRGIIVEPCKSAFPNPNVDLYTKLILHGTKILFINDFYPQLTQCQYIKDDNYHGGYMLGEYLLSLGHKKIAGIFPYDQINGLERCYGVACCLRDNHLLFDDRNICRCSYEDLTLLREKQDSRFLTTFIKTQLQSCSAVVCHNDEIAYWLLKEFAYAGISVPREVNVVSFENSYLGELSKTRITTLTHNPHEMGTTIAEYMKQKIKGIPVVSQEIPWQLLARNSSDAYIS